MKFKNYQCAVCGVAGESHNRHHLFPRCYYKHKRIDLTYAYNTNILRLCLKCHEKYEKYGNKLKENIAQYYGLNIYQNGMATPLVRAKNMARNLSKPTIARFKTYDEFNYMKRFIEQQFGLITEENSLEKIAAVPIPKYPAEENVHHQIVNKIQDWNSFVLMWYKHFFYVMEPKFLPYHWRSEYNFGCFNVDRHTGGSIITVPRHMFEDLWEKEKEYTNEK